MLKTIIFLFFSNLFMTFAWYGHLKNFNHKPLLFVILFSWGVAFFEYVLQVPANRIGFHYYSLGQLKVIQEVITLTVFVIFTLLVFKTESFRMNHVIGFIFLVLAVYFIFKK